MNSTTSAQKIIIIGGGPAGLSAAVYAARAGFTPLVFAGSPSGGQLMLTSDVENFPGRAPVMGPELIQQMRVQASSFGSELLDQNVTHSDLSRSPFEITAQEKKYSAHALIIATGAQALWLGLESETRLRGKGVSACATCDGFFFRNKIVAVVGGGDTAMEEAHTLTNFANTVFLIHRRDSFRASSIMQQRVLTNKKIVPIVNNEIVEILGDTHVTGIRLRNCYEGKTEISLNGVFMAIGHKPDTGLFVPALAADKKGYLFTAQSYALKRAHYEESMKNEYVFDYTYPTISSVPGIFIAGDCADHLYRQAGTAAGTGIAAALDAERWINTKLHG